MAPCHCCPLLRRSLHCLAVQFTYCYSYYSYKYYYYYSYYYDYYYSFRSHFGTTSD